MMLCESVSEVIIVDSATLPGIGLSNFVTGGENL